MARILLIGCGCRGRELARALADRGHMVRGTTRDPGATSAIAAAGAEPAVADPDRLGTLMPLLPGVSVLCWLMGSAQGSRQAVAALHGPRLESIGEALVDTHVRGLVYQAGGSVTAALLEDGARVVERLGATFHMPVAVVHEDPRDVVQWRAAMADAVDGVLAS